MHYTSKSQFHPQSTASSNILLSFHPYTTTGSFFISYRLVHFSKLYFSSSWVCSSLSHLIWKKTKALPQSTFWLLSSFSQNSWRNSLQCFPLLHSIHLASFQKTSLTLLLQTSSAIFYSWNKSMCSIFAGVHCYPFILISLTSMPSSSVAFFHLCCSPFRLCLQPCRPFIYFLYKPLLEYISMASITNFILLTLNHLGLFTDEFWNMYGM